MMNMIARDAINFVAREEPLKEVATEVVIGGKRGVEVERNGRKGRLLFLMENIYSITS